MSIENITGKILAEAREQSEQVLKEAGDKSRAIIEKAEAQAEKIRKEHEEKAEEDACLLKSRRTSVAELEVRKMKLAAKRPRLTCFDRRLDKLPTGGIRVSGVFSLRYFGNRRRGRRASLNERGPEVHRRKALSRRSTEAGNGRKLTFGGRLH